MDREKGDNFRVLISSSGDYSIWPDGRALPLGWDATEIVGIKSACLTYIEREWTMLSPAPAANRCRVGTTNASSFLEGEIL